MKCLFSALVCACIALGHTESVPEDRSRVACETIEARVPADEFDPWEVAAMAWRESRFDPEALGGGGEIGLLQVKPRYVRGKFTRAQLYTPDGNVDAALVGMRWGKSLGGKNWHHCYASGVSCYHPTAVSYARGIRAWMLRWAEKNELQVGSTH